MEIFNLLKCLYLKLVAFYESFFLSFTCKFSMGFLFLFNIPMTEVSENSVIMMIWRVIEAQRLRGEQMTVECLLNEEKLIHLSILSLESHAIKKLPFYLGQEIIQFVLKINKATM